MSVRIRGKEVTVQIIHDGSLMDGSFTKVESFSFTPRTDLVEADFVGEVLTDLDEMHHGYDFSFSIQVKDNKPFEVLATRTSADEASTAPPQVNLLFTVTFRDLGEPRRVYAFSDCVLKMGEFSVGSRTDYATVSWEGKAKRMDQL